jgi:tripartite-type tricarboxylate transporter receptor subunit TctC
LAGQTVIVENSGGAGGTIGAAKVAKASPDGYTLLFHNMAQASAPALYSKLPYDPATDFIPIGIVTDVPMVLVARKDFPAESLQGFIDYVRANLPTNDFTIWCGAIDEELTSHSYIVPGLGDAGDLAYGVKI